MKRRKLFMGAACALLLLFASSVSVMAMDFDAEEEYESIFVVYSGNYIGSGFAIGSNTVVTNAHVIGDENSITLHTYDGETYRAGIYMMNELLDIAILSVENADFTPLEVGDCDALKIGDDIYAVGAPESLEYTLTKGIVSSKDRVINGQSYIQIDAAVNSGNSGGPLLNASGQVLGVISMKLSDAEGIGLAIPISTVVSYMENGDITVTDGNTVSGELPFTESVPAEDSSSGPQNFPAETDTPEKNEDSAEDDAAAGDHHKKISTPVIILCAVLVVCVLAGSVLLIRVVYRKNRNHDYIPDASERTDFDIDIWE